MGLWEDIQALLTKTTTTALVSIYATVNGVMTLERITELTSALALISLLLGIIVAVLSIRSLLLRQTLMRTQLVNEEKREARMVKAAEADQADQAAEASNTIITEERDKRV